MRLRLNSLKIVLTALSISALYLGLANASDASQDYQNTTGLLDFLLASAGQRRDLFPVEKISGAAVTITAARAIAEKTGMRVYGSVARIPSYSPAREGHVDVIVLDRTGKILTRVSVDYFPRDIPQSLRGTIGRSHFNVSFSSVPAGASAVRVAYSALPKETGRHDFMTSTGKAH